MTDRPTGRTEVYNSKMTTSAGVARIESQTTVISTATTTKGYALMYSEYGNPSVVLQKEEFNLPTELQNDEVLVEILAAPINPSDVLCVQGYYPFKPPLPATGGFEGIGKIIEIGSNVTEVQVGDWVIPGKVETTGTWRTHAVWSENNIRKIPNDIPVLAAATIAVNPPTAYRMLNDFVTLQPGDVVIQNGANSGVGEAVIQIARYMKLVTINVIRSRPDIEDLKQHLTKLGADYVVTEEELRSEEFKNSLPIKPKLAFDCVGGQSASDLLNSLANGGTMVTYGAMSRQPVTVATQNLIFQDVTVRGFWMSQWKRENCHSPEARKTTEYLCDLIREGKLLPPKFEEIALDDYKSAMEKSMSGFKGVKQIFVMKNENTADFW